ncbi:hypothetical protein CFOL_v3_06062 [Cephalotus follicularis]|uniref:Uncharacterized protein n=1 Tax=Cephalotus follicularis TaxID=3775 RepID=A0A1Q3B3M7_CEPFO|nr:hypothetical protein CFOL_v3_06062 [Cephalotus follicularis]
MERNKSRTDLLAAGRKKLQQYRQKKDGKGSSGHGKTSKKSSKSELDESNGDAASTDAKPEASLLSTSETEITMLADSSRGNVDLSMSNSTENTLAAGVDVAAVDQSSATITPIPHFSELPVQEVAVGKHECQHDVDFSVLNEPEITQTVDVEGARSEALGTYSEGEAKNADMSNIVDVLATPASVHTTKEIAVAIETEDVNREVEPESLISLENFPDTSSTQAREYQVTDEAHGLGLNQFDKSGGTELEEDGAFSLSEFYESSETLQGASSEGVAVDGLTHEAKQTTEADGASASAVNVSDGFSASALALPEAYGISAVSPDVKIHQSENVGADSSDAEKFDRLSGSSEGGDDRKGGFINKIDCEPFGEGFTQKHLHVGSIIYEDRYCERPLESEFEYSAKESTVPSSGDGYSISFLQLMDLIRGLGEVEFRFLLQSRQSDYNAELGMGCLSVLENGLPDLMEKLKEELYLTNCTKDIFHLQLAEQSDLQTEFDHQHRQLVDEISKLRVSFNEVLERNENLAEDLANCRSELQAAAAGREELLNQLCNGKSEGEELSVRAHELQISLEKSQGELSSLSMELADCKNIIAVLQVENENLNTTIALVMEEKKKLVEEKEPLLHENEKLSTELADCKNLLAALQLEISNLSGTVALFTEENTKLEEEKESLARGCEKLSTELTNCKGFLAALQVESANLQGSFALIAEDKKNLEEDKVNFIQEMERLSSELLLLQEQLLLERREHMQTETNLKEATVRLEQLTEENIFLNSTVEIHKAKIREIDYNKACLPSRVVEDLNQNESSEACGRGHEIERFDEHSSQTAGRLDSEVSLPGLDKPSHEVVARGLPLEPVEQEVFKDSFGFGILMGHLKEAENIFQNLERAIEDMHFQATSSSKSVGKVAAPAVSKLIQAFESKGHHDEPEEEGRSVTEDRSPADPFMLTKEQTGILKSLLKQLVVDAENASVLFKGERDGRENANVTFKELKVVYEALKEQSDSVKVTNIELGVLCEALKQHVSGVEAKNNELEFLCEALRQEDISLKAENSELGERLIEYQSKVSELQSQLHDLQQSSDEMASVLCKQLESLQKEVADQELTLEQERSSAVAQIVDTVGRLDRSIGRLSASAISSSFPDNLDTNSRIAASVDAAIEVMDDLQQKLQAAFADHEAISSSYKEVNEKFNDLLGKNELAISILQIVYGDLRKLASVMSNYLDETEINMQHEELKDPVDYSQYKTLTDQLENFLGERLELESMNRKLTSDLIGKAKDIEEMNRKCLEFKAIQRLVEDVEGVVKLDDSEINLDDKASSRLESLVYLLVQKYKEAGGQVSASREELGSKVMELTELQDNIHQLNALNLQHETEILVLRESLSLAEEAFTVAHSQLQEKVSELEQSEQRVSSIREKLSMAVAKGKGLVVQRDSLKQSLAETSSELERCSQELQLKDARLHEVETKLKTYSEAGERVEALESELSYIRNSATALRESFLLKDSVLQRIEEILEELDLPEHFHSRDIIEKVDWLARSATVNSLHATDWDQKSSVGGSYSDSGFAVMDAWKEVQPSSNSGEDLKRKFEELNSKFYGLAEQNEMLEQSLMERNHLVQRWEELLDGINMPTHLRSMEPEDRIEWLGSSLAEANQERNSLQQKIDNLENYCGSLSADLEDSRKRISDLEADLQAVNNENEHVFERLELLTGDREKLSATVVQFELENEKLQNDVSVLQERLVERLGNEDRILLIESEIRRLQSLVSDALQDPDTNDLVSGGNGTECLERLLRKLIENYTTLLLVKPLPEDAVDCHHTEEADANLVVPSRDILVSEESDLAVLKKELEGALHDLMCVKEERDKYMEKQQSLISEVEALYKRREELQELLNQEEQKSASVREKLIVAVRKGKSLVQQRDSLKQTIEEMNIELERLKSEIKQWEDGHLEYEQKTRDLSTYSVRVEALESETLILRNRLTETDHILQEREHTLTLILETLGGIGVDGEVAISDPVERLHRIGILFHDLHAAVASSEIESRKSKRAAELLLAELNEVQERNDSLQEDLAKAARELAELSKAREVAEAARIEAVSHLKELSTARSEEKKKHYSEFMVLKSVAVQLMKGFSDIKTIVVDVISKDLEYLHNLEVNMESCLKRRNVADMAGMLLSSAPGSIHFSFSENKENILSADSLSDPKVPDNNEDDVIVEVCNFLGHQLQEIMTDFDSLKARLQKHSISLHEQASSLFTVMQNFQREMTSQEESLEAMKIDIARLESIEKDKDMEIVVLHNYIVMLYEACARSVMEVENRKAEVTGSNLVAGHLGMNLDRAALAAGVQTHIYAEEHIKTMVDKLLLVVKDFASLKENVEGNQKVMKITIANLQKELQEKDIQKDRICMELVSQIKEAEATSNSYSLDLQFSRDRILDLEKRVEVLEEERNLLEQKVKELKDGKAIATELLDRISSLNDVLAAKDQEIESLMQALDEEEAQMETLRNKTEELENFVKHKDLDLGNLEASREKIAKKLSITVSKFDELHNLSESLLTEVEKLQLQLQDRDAEISFLRQEVTRCTNDVLVASQMSNKRSSDAIHEFFTWFDSMISRVGGHVMQLDDTRSSEIHEYKETLQKKINSIISELEDTRAVAQSREALLQVEQSKVEGVSRRAELLEKFLREKDCQVNMLEGTGNLDRATSISEIVEVEPVMNKWAIPGTTSQVRSLRKLNNDQVAIAIDMNPDNSNTLEDEDEDKVHGFKSLTTSRIVPKFTRPVTDMIDGLWVSCDRALMRQPVLRLGIIIYWAVMHALLATFVV